MGFFISFKKKKGTLGCIQINRLHPALKSAVSHPHQLHTFPSLEKQDRNLMKHLGSIRQLNLTVKKYDRTFSGKTNLNKTSTQLVSKATGCDRHSKY